MYRANLGYSNLYIKSSQNAEDINDLDLLLKRLAKLKLHSTKEVLNVRLFCLCNKNVSRIAYMVVFPGVGRMFDRRFVCKGSKATNKDDVDEDEDNEEKFDEL